MNHESGIQDARVHGGMSYELLTRLGVASDDLLDLSVNVNPYGPAPAVVAAIRSASFEAYPDPQGAHLKHAIALTSGISPAGIVVGNGAADLLWTLVRTLLVAGDTAMIAEPTFCEFRAACQASRVRLLEWRARSCDHFRFDMEALSQELASHQPRVLYLCNPNSPTGQYVPLDQVRALAERHEDTAIILDEAFLSLSRHYDDAQKALPSNVIRLRSFTKEHTIAGLRLGYLLTTERLARALESHRPAWMINSVAEAAALAALHQEDFVAVSRDKIFRDLECMQAALQQLGLAPLPTTTLYFLLPLPAAGGWRERLLKHRILVRDCASYGLPGYIRLCSRPQADVQRLISALKMELEHL
jgi:histidinol-phosphate/aromatic aminotransferase/cobyric acid decarboxylase-like protein